MQVICTDGTTFGCESYELTEYGVMLYGQEHDPEDERYDSDPEKTGYVPHDRLWYVLPDGVRPNVPGEAPAQGQPQQPPNAALQAGAEQPGQAQVQFQQPGVQR